MFRKPVQCNCFIYYGCVVSEGEITSAIRRMKKEKNIDLFLKSNGLDYQRIGHAARSSKYIIGKELYAQKAFTHMKLDLNDGKASLYHNDGSLIKLDLSNQEKLDISSSIYKIGFFNLADFYLVHNYEINQI